MSATRRPKHQGKKTYAVAIATVVYGAGVQFGWWPHVPVIDYALGGSGLAALRAGVNKR
jgi:hypothetical protein